jgi:periplasmic protein CpxP/Spy
MQNIQWSKSFGILILGLLLVNLGVLIWMSFFKNGPPPPNQISPMIIERELGFEGAQKQVFEKIKTQHFNEVGPLRDSIRILKREAQQMLRQTPLDTATLHEKINQLSQKIAQNEWLTLKHFGEIRAMCQPEQQRIFDEVLLPRLGRPMDPRKNEGPRHGPKPMAQHFENIR